MTPEAFQLHHPPELHPLPLIPGTIFLPHLMIGIPPDAPIHTEAKMKTNNSANPQTLTWATVIDARDQAPSYVRCKLGYMLARSHVGSPHRQWCQMFAT